MGKNVCIVTSSDDSADLRDMVAKAGGHVAAELASLRDLPSDGSAAFDVVLLDRADACRSAEAVDALSAHCPVATYGKAGSSTLDSVESSCAFQLRHPLCVVDLERLFSRIEVAGGRSEKTKLPRPLHLYRGLVGESAVVRDLRTVIERVAPSKASVLILGETGTGKEVVARNIHYRSRNGGGAFVALNCSAIPAHLLESELFGHKKGAFTGAIGDRVGRFEQAAGGTLFLDEIGDMPLVLQVKLLRVLEERMIYPLGGDRPIPMTARLIAATHRDLEKRVAQGSFREDLYYRLNVVPLTVPPLRTRREDIPALARELACRIKAEQKVTVEFAEDAIACLQTYDWPGNIRELANLVERLTVLYPDGRIRAHHLPAEIRGITESAEMTENAEPPALTDGFDLRDYLRSTERQLIREALDSSDGVVTHAAKMLRVRRTTLTEKVRRLGLGDLVKQAG